MWPAAERLSRRIAVPALLGLAAVLAVTSLWGDSITYDETAHLPAGIVHLKLGDLRLAPDHPPLARLWAALPSLVLPANLPDMESAAWKEGDFILVGRDLLFRRNHGEGLLLAGRCMIVVLFLGLCLLVHATARRLFGEGAAFLALAVAALSPSLLAHARLVTTDLPAALATLAVLVATARLAEGLTPLRLAAASSAMVALALTKFSWPVVVPALVVMGMAVALRRAPWSVALPGRPAFLLEGRLSRFVTLGVCVAAFGLVTWAGAWACYGFRYSPYRGPHVDEARMQTVTEGGKPMPSTHAGAWEALLTENGEPVKGATAASVRWMRAHRVLPEAYLYGVMLLERKSHPRVAYFHGEIGYGGFALYFPVAFAIKSTLPELVLYAAALAALLSGRARARDSILLAGFAAFLVSYAVFAVAATMNIGHRHILPVYPVLAVLAGAAGAWGATRAGRLLVPVLVAWLAAEAFLAYPGYLGYFNELVGGSKNGWRWLADSNIDWGQDLKRLSAWVRKNGDPVVKLSFFGTGLPAAYGIDCEELASPLPIGRKATLDAGVYVVSVNELLAPFYPPARDDFWESPRNRAYYASIHRRVASGTEAPLDRENLETLRVARLLNALKRRPPDDRVGTSLFIFRLTESEIDAILRPDS